MQKKINLSFFLWKLSLHTPYKKIPWVNLEWFLRRIKSPTILFEWYEHADNFGTTLYILSSFSIKNALNPL